MAANHRTFVFFLLISLGMMHPALAQKEEITITNIYSPAATDLRIEPGSNILHVGGHLLPLLTDTYDFGSPNKLWNQGYLAQLNAILFALNTQTLFGGYSTIGYNAGSFAAAVGSGDTTIDFGTTMTPGHFVLTRGHDTSGALTSEYFQVGAVDSGTVYNVTRNLSGLGAKNWAQGTPFLVLGTTGISRIDMLAYDGKPRIQFVEQGATYNSQTVRGVIGNLNGYYSYSTDLNGIVFGNASGARFMLDPTNGVRIYGGDNDAKVTIDTSGNATFDGALTIGTNRNGVRNSECRVNAEDWTTSTTSGFTVNGPAKPTAPYLLGGEAGCYIALDPATAPTGVTDAYLSGQLISVAVGQTYEASVYLSMYRATGTMFIMWLNNSLGVISLSTSSTTCPGTGSGAEFALSAWCRAGVIATAPANASFGVLSVRMIHDGINSNPYLFWVRSFFGEAGPAQEDLTPWGPGGIAEISNGMIRTDAINARTIAASAITSDKIAANAIIAGKIAAGVITATEIAANTITGDQIAAIQLSAISADLGTITAGSISAVTVSSSTLSGNTITGGSININSGAFEVDGAGDVSTDFISASDSFTTAAIIVDLTVQDQIFTNYTGGGNRYVCTNNSGELYPSSACTAGPDPVAALASEIAALKSELAELKAAFAQLFHQRN